VTAEPVSGALVRRTLTCPAWPVSSCSCWPDEIASHWGKSSKTPLIKVQPRLVVEVGADAALQAGQYRALVTDVWVAGLSWAGWLAGSGSVVWMGWRADRQVVLRVG
jgi:hypothetical protein